MRDKHYKIKGYRLSKETIIKLAEIKEETNQSYNLLFIELIELYEKN